MLRLQDAARTDLKTLLEEERKKRTAAEAENKRVEAEAKKDREARRSAEMRAATAEGRVNDAGARVQSEIDARYRAQEDSITAQMAAADADAERLEGEIVALQEAGKFADAAKLTRQLGSAAARAENLKMMKAEIESQKARIKTQVTNSDPLDGYTPASRAWISNHPQYLSDERYRNRVVSAHHLAKAEGHAADSEAYFTFIEDQLAGRQPEPEPEPRRAPAKRASDPHEPEPEPVPEPEPEPEPRRQAPVAPVARRTPINEGTPMAGQIRLSALEKEHADATMPDILENDYTDPKTGQVMPGRYRLYHERKQRLKEEGRITFLQ